ncbi:MAG: carboxypeptidase-like regulatory domain-containing protein, partial [Flavobacteriales bacterium]|nr:carboxypeptidase-like regulatory domain-containing protein [Flavobacteriales bacterium]
MRALSFLCFLCLSSLSIGQGVATLRGSVSDPDGLPLAFASVLVRGTDLGTATDENGRFRLEIPADTAITILFSFTGMVPREVVMELRSGEEKRYNVKLGLRTLGEVEVETRRTRDPGIEVLDAKLTRFVPTPLGGVESLLSGQIGVVMRNELSSGYSVRGGNFDENLVYVNDIEVYRPFLVRAGQQEGLSFPNPDMIERINFSAGGFEARYGDKMSSVLDITYRRPKEFGGSAMISLLGGSISLENTMLNKRLRQITGFRYRTNSYLLRGLDTQGEYDPKYIDLQSYWTFDLSDKVELGFLGLYSSNVYGLTPQTRETELGNFNEALRFTVFFEGQERTFFDTWFGAFNLNWQAGKDLLLKFQASAYSTRESEHFTILGQYFLDELDRDLGSDQFGEVVRNLGVGSFLDHARNDLDARVITVAHKGFKQLRGSYLQWGVDARTEAIQDRLNEWTLIDSAGYSVPQSTGEDLELNYALRSQLFLESVRASAYIQNEWKWRTGTERHWGLNVGARAQHWSYNGQTVISPRLRVNYHPGW